MKIAPSILAADFSKLKDELESIENSDFIHIDVMDGHFVPNISFGCCVIESIRKVTQRPFDVHLMITNPLKYIKQFALAGSDYISVHVECEDDTSACIEMIKAEGKRAGIVISPDTPADAVLPYINEVEIITVMSVYPGFGGQKFIEATYEKVRKIKEYAGDRELLLSVDGGVGAHNIKELSLCGANTVVMGTAVFKSEDRRQMIEDLKKF